MSLAILKLKAEEKLLRSKKSEQELVKQEIVKRTAIAENALNDIASDGDLKIATEECENIEKKLKENEELTKGINKRMKEIEESIKEIEDRQKDVLKEDKQEEVKGNKISEELSNKREEKEKMPLNLRAKNKYERKERTRMVLANEEFGTEVRSFYTKLVDVIKKREVLNTDLIIPEIVMDMISIDMTFAGRIYGLITEIPLKGVGRIIVSGETPEAIWVECCDPIDEVDIDFGMIELDCYKIAAYVSICNANLEDAFINLATHVQEQLTLAILKAVEKAILTGDGDKKPIGITKAIATDLPINKIDSTSKFKDLIMLNADLPDNVGNVTAVMTRTTYYKLFAAQTVVATATGQIVAQSHINPKLPDGTPVAIVSSDTLADGEMILGDFKKYLLSRRSGTTVETSTHVKFIEDQTLIKAVARYDGRPQNAKYFLHIKLTDYVAPATSPAKVPASK